MKKIVKKIKAPTKKPAVKSKVAPKKAVKTTKKKVASSPVIKNTPPALNYDVVIVGGGPAGLMAACMAGESGAKVLILEKNDTPGKKLLISGGGRCNFTNANPNHREFVSKFGKKGNFLYSPFSVFGVQDTIKFFNNLGLESKIEPGFRVFPVSNNSEDILEILVDKAKSEGVEFKLNSEVESFATKAGKVVAVILKSGERIEAKSFILATGGLSHPETGSTGDGLRWLTEIGHKVVKPNPALVPLKISEPWITGLAGITVDNAGISVWQDNQKVINKKGRVLFTHIGLTGPTVLNMSKSVGELLEYAKAKDAGAVTISLDFFPGVGLDQMHEMTIKAFELNVNKKVRNLVFPEVPNKIFDLILEQLEIDPEWEVNEVKREERLALVEKFKKFEMKVGGLLGFDKAIIMSGGLDLGEVNFKTMGSKLYPNLFLAGDILDFDRPSGGFSLQICWTTGYIAGKSAVK